ncbi:MAG: hypothetical protein ABI841_04475 [Chloroflexota bacterium]
MTDNVVLFDAQLGTQHVRVWIEADEAGLRIVSHDVGPGLERTVGKSELAAFLEVDAEQLPAIRTALLAERADASEQEAELEQLLLEKYRGDSTATGNFRAWLDTHAIPYRFTLV